MQEIEITSQRMRLVALKTHRTLPLAVGLWVFILITYGLYMVIFKNIIDFFTFLCYSFFEIDTQ